MVDTEIIPEYIGLIGATSMVASLTLIKDKNISPILFWGGLVLGVANIFKLINEETQLLDDLPIPDLDIPSLGESEGDIENEPEPITTGTKEGGIAPPGYDQEAEGFSGRSRIAPKNQFRLNIDKYK